MKKILKRVLLTIVSLVVLIIIFGLTLSFLPINLKQIMPELLPKKQLFEEEFHRTA